MSGDSPRAKATRTTSCASWTPSRPRARWRNGGPRRKARCCRRTASTDNLSGECPRSHGPSAHPGANRDVRPAWSAWSRCYVPKKSASSNACTFSTRSVSRNGTSRTTSTARSATARITSRKRIPATILYGWYDTIDASDASDAVDVFALTLERGFDSEMGAALWPFSPGTSCSCLLFLSESDLPFFSCYAPLISLWQGDLQGWPAKYPLIPDDDPPRDSASQSHHRTNPSVEGKYSELKSQLPGLYQSRKLYSPEVASLKISCWIGCGSRI